MKGFTHATFSVASIFAFKDFFIQNRPIIPLTMFSSPYGSLVTLQDGYDVLICLGLIILGSLIVDIDIIYSTLGRWNPFVFFMKHRGKMHTPLTGIMLTGLIIPYNMTYALAFGYGFFSHLITDSLTHMGIMWLYPIKKKYYSLHVCRPGGAVEGFIFAVSVFYLWNR